MYKRQLYEGLSTNTKVYVFHHEQHIGGQYGEKRKTKVTRNIDRLKKEGLIGYIDSSRYFFSRTVRDVDIIHPKKNKPLSESRRVVQELLEKL